MRKGFSILEAVLTVALLGVVLLPLTNVLRKAEAIAAHTAAKQNAVALASSLLETETFNQSAEIIIPEKFEIKKETAFLPNGIKQVTVNISWQDEFNKPVTVALHRRYYEGID